jgi:hypothetical protein
LIQFKAGVGAHAKFGRRKKLAIFADPNVGSPGWIAKWREFQHKFAGNT